MNPSESTCSAEPELQVPSIQYDEEWIRETWGWDTPENFIRSQGRNLRPRILASLQLAGLQPGMRILDVGCGRGEVVLHCGRLGIDAVGIDYSRPAIELAEKARASHSPHERKRMQFVCGDVKDLRTNHLFDLIFMLDLVEHLHDWELSRLFEICRQLLEPKGVLIIHTLPNKWLYDITYGRILRLFMPWLPPDPRTEKEKAIHINEMTITHLAEVLDRSGFEQRVWLDDLLTEQARWHSKQPLSDQRGMVYRLMAKPFVAMLYKLICKTPARLLIVNEMFAVAWKAGQEKPIRTPVHLTESLVIRIASSKKNRPSAPPIFG
jgi:2-polyprenyl-3-methyl-5-hydroxy-6-metoxy-1,4-benzoquinol methylase